MDLATHAAGITATSCVWQRDSLHRWSFREGQVEPDPFHPGRQRVDDYNTGQPLREVRPDPFNVDQSVIDDR
jgi:hypothetical protein